MDHRHQFAGGNPHLPAAGCAAVEGESGDHRCLQISTQDTRSQASPGMGNLGRGFPSKCRYRGGQRPLQAEDGIWLPLGPLERERRGLNHLILSIRKSNPSRMVTDIIASGDQSGPRTMVVRPCSGSDLTMGDRVCKLCFS